MTLLRRLLDWLLTGTWGPAAPSAPALTLRQGPPGMSKPYLVTVGPPASKDPSAARLAFTYTIAPAGGPASAASTVDATAAAPAIGLDAGETLSGYYVTADARGVTSPAGPPASVAAPVAPSAPALEIANAPADPPPAP